MKWEELKRNRGQVRKWRSGVYKIVAVLRGQRWEYSVLFMADWMKNWGNHIDPDFTKYPSLTEAKKAAEKHAKFHVPSRYMEDRSDKAWEKIKKINRRLKR